MGLPHDGTAAFFRHRRLLDFLGEQRFLLLHLLSLLLFLLLFASFRDLPLLSVFLLLCLLSFDLLELELLLLQRVFLRFPFRRFLPPDSFLFRSV